MMGAMIPFNINTMSIFSFSGKLCKAGNFIHPSYLMDDIIALIMFRLASGGGSAEQTLSNWLNIEQDKWYTHKIIITLDSKKMRSQKQTLVIDKQTRPS